MNLLLTGATGFVGSHLALRWLIHDTTARIGCVVRAVNADTGLLRLRSALMQAAADEDVDVVDLLARIDALPGNLDDSAWIDKAAAWMQGPTEFIHCAANLSFREADRPAIWHSNVDGTASVLRALPRLPGIVAFDYVSTAYVAGDRQGEILEGERDRPCNFNNPYEHSKWTAEGLVRTACAASGTPWRILRPSIVIGHSKTHRLSSQSDFYQVVETLLSFGRRPGMPSAPILLPVTAGTNLDLMPVDKAVDEIMALIAGGGTTANQTFHVVAADPLQLADVLRELSPMSGVAIQVNGPDTPLTPVAKIMMHRLRYYMPYFAFARRFDRSGAQAALGAMPYRIGVEQLRGFVQSYMVQQGCDQPMGATA